MKMNLSFHQAEELCKKTDYAVFAVEPEDGSNNINMADAAAFFLEGYNYCLRKMEKYLSQTIERN